MVDNNTSELKNLLLESVTKLIVGNK